ncbi:MAG: hypothetical protein ACRD2W_06020 [Acidimicrobiales bacterium]
MSMTVEVPEPLAGRLAAEAERRGVSATEIAVEALEAVYGPSEPAPTGEQADAVAAFIGCFDSGDPNWASTDTHVLRAQAAARRPA